MMSQKTLAFLNKKARASKPKVRTVAVEDGDVVFVEVPAYRLPTLVQLSSTTFSIKLYPLK